MKTILWLLISVSLIRALPSFAAEEQPAILKDVGIRPVMGSTIPMDETLLDENGLPVSLKSFLDGKHPVVIVFSYFTCPMLCSMILSGARDAFQKLDWKMGDQYKVVTISIDPHDDPAAARAKKLDLLSASKSPAFREAAEKNWHFLVGRNAAEARVAEAFGFHYKWVEEEHQYAHGAALYLVSPDGKLARTIEGFDFNPRDLKLALLETSQGKVGSFAEKLMLFCYHYDPKDNKYALFASRLVSLGGALTVAIMLLFYLVLYLRNRRKGNACSLSP